MVATLFPAWILFLLLFAAAVILVIVKTRD